MQKALIVVGPTAVGKTALSIKLAKKYGGVLFSSDSVQVYKGLDIISGKDKNVLADTPTKLLDVMLPTDPFSVGQFIAKFTKELRTVSDKMPIVVGGTGFYVSALLGGIETGNVKPNKKLRDKLSKFSVEKLQEELQKVNPKKLERMNNSDRNNPRRLIRAIEVAYETKNHQAISSPFSSYETFIIGLTASKNVLERKIDKRVDDRLKQGALQEAQELYKEFSKLSDQVKTASGYKQLFNYLQGDSSYEVAIEEWKLVERRNAKKQMTFLRKLENVAWYNIETPYFEAKIMKQVQDFLS